uniref:DUF1640 domain-containing protein n=1 Tax=Candidatus Kentrum sp. FW TaxID=2126338 RepID=A0A450U0L5_9GAMM|nr:MAG: hypothetical protein BECKFW1821C_GA0114237_10917 [Candidatus Kentron sp. FW]
MSGANRQLTLQEVSEYMRAHIGEWLAEEGLAKPSVVYEIELRERMVRVEEELKLMEKRFESVDRRFEAMARDNNERFEGINKRFEEVNNRFDTLTERIDRFMIWSFGVTMGAVFFAVTLSKTL